MSDYHLPSDCLGYCRSCGVNVRTDSFRDLDSMRDYSVDAFCQRCQDAVFLGVAGDPPVLHPVRHGVLIAPASGDDAPSELALLPFVFVALPTTPQLLFEPRYTIRAGPEFAAVDPWVEFEPMHDDWDGYNVRVLCVRSAVDPSVRRALAGRDLVIGLDEPSVSIAAHLCPEAPPAAALVSLADAVPWADAYRTPLLPLAPFLRTSPIGVVAGGADRCRTSVLRQCAVLARLLALPAVTGPDAGRTAFELLLRGHAARFEESSSRRTSDAS